MSTIDRSSTKKKDGREVKVLRAGREAGDKAGATLAFHGMPLPHTDPNLTQSHDSLDIEKHGNCECSGAAV